MGSTPGRSRQRRPFEQPIEMNLRGCRVEPENGSSHRGVIIGTDRGDIRCRYHPAPLARRAAVWVGGAIGGFHSPALGLYSRLARELQEHHIASLHVSFRHSTVIEEATMDVLAGIQFLEQEGIGGVALTGHSFGGAAVIQAASRAPRIVHTVVTLATQSYGIDPVATLGDRCPILLIHGEDDELLPVRCSEYAFSKADGPKVLHVLPGGRHALDEVADDVHRLVRDWITQHLDHA
jgi:dienelactone hydrolase